MIYGIFCLINLKIYKQKIIFDSSKFFELDQEIQAKLIDISYKFINPKKTFLRYKKIINLLNKITYFDDISASIGNVKLKKDSRFLYIFA